MVPIAGVLQVFPSGLGKRRLPGRFADIIPHELVASVLPDLPIRSISL